LEDNGIKESLSEESEQDAKDAKDFEE